MFVWEVDEARDEAGDDVGGIGDSESVRMVGSGRDSPWGRWHYGEAMLWPRSSRLLRLERATLVFLW